MQKAGRGSLSGVPKAGPMPALERRWEAQSDAAPRAGSGLTPLGQRQQPCNSPGRN